MNTYNRIICLLIFIVTTASSLPSKETLRKIFLNGLKSYTDHMLLNGAHAIGHMIPSYIARLKGFEVSDIEEYSAKTGKVLRCYKGDPTISCEVQTIPYLKIPFGFRSQNPIFCSDRANAIVTASGPLVGLAACYLRLKIAQIYSNYSKEKTLYENIKAGLTQPVYRGHSRQLLMTVGLHALANTLVLIPGNHKLKKFCIEEI